MEYLQIQIISDGTSGTRTRPTHMLTFRFVEICSSPSTTAPRHRVPNATHVGIHIRRLCVYDAIPHFKFGAKATLDVLKYQMFNQVNIRPGYVILFFSFIHFFII